MDKRKYSKPRIRKIKLSPQEAVLGICKMSSGSTLTRCNCTLNKTLAS